MKAGILVFFCLLALKVLAMVFKCLRASLSGSRLARAINSFRRLGQGVGKVECCPVLDLEKADFKGLAESQNRTQDFSNGDMRGKSRNRRHVISKGTRGDYLIVERRKRRDWYSQRFLVNPICCPHMPLRAVYDSSISNIRLQASSILSQSPLKGKAQDGLSQLQNRSEEVRQRSER